MSGGVTECDRSVAVHVGEERPADIIIAAINIDRSRSSRIVAINCNRRVVGHGSSARNIHVDGGATLRARTDAAARVIDLSRQRIRSNVGRRHIDRGIPTDCSTIAVINCEDRVALSCEIALETKLEIRVPADAAAA